MAVVFCQTSRVAEQGRGPLRASSLPSLQVETFSMLTDYRKKLSLGFLKDKRVEWLATSPSTGWVLLRAVIRDESAEDDEPGTSAGSGEGDRDSGDGKGGGPRGDEDGGDSNAGDSGGGSDGGRAKGSCGLTFEEALKMVFD